MVHKCLETTAEVGITQLHNLGHTNVQGLTEVSCCAIFQNPPPQYNKRQTIANEIGKCPDEGLGPTCNFSIFTISDQSSSSGHDIDFCQ